MPGPGGLGIGIGQPSREWRRTGVDQKARQDQPARNGVVSELAEGDRPGGSDLSGDARHEQYAAEQMDGGIAEPSALGARSAAPHDQRRADGHHLPEDEDADEVARQGDADGAAGIDESRGELGGARLIQREQAPGERHEGEDGGEQPRELVAPHQDQIEAKERSLSTVPSGTCQTRAKRHERQRR